MSVASRVAPVDQAGTVEVFDSKFNLVKTFTDPDVPAGFAP